MPIRRKAGGETTARLLDWSKGQTAAERLAGHVLRGEGFESIDPIHPLGGPDGLKDFVCRRQTEKWIAAAYFPHGQKTFPSVARKVKHDAAGVAANGAVGLAFVTNQRLTEGERKALQKALGEVRLEVFHLERTASILDTPAFCGIRLEFLDIELSKDEQVAFFADHRSLFQETKRLLAHLMPLAEAAAAGDAGRVAAAAPAVPLAEIREFSQVLDRITGTSSYTAFGLEPHVNRLRVPLAELKEFTSILDQIAGTGLLTAFGAGPHVNRLRVPLAELKEFVSILGKMTGTGMSSHVTLGASIDRLRVPLDEIRQHEEVLDRILAKQERLRHQ